MEISRSTTRSWRSRARRAFVATVVGVVPIVSLAPAASANTLGGLQTGASWAHVVASVGPNTPLWTLDVTFTLSGVDCTNGAELHYKIHTSAEKSLLCGPGGAAPTSWVVQRPVFAAAGSPGISELTPNMTAEVRAEVRNLANGLNNNPGGAVRSINVPPPPKWIGMGDGYTSAMSQPLDGGAHNSNDRTISWIKAAATKLNGIYNPPTNWRVVPVIVADEAATSSTLSSQVATMKTELASATGSWNWIGISVGLRDLGIPGILDSWYAANGSTASHTPPWELPHGATNCPVLPSTTEAATVGSSVKTNVVGVVNQAKGVDPSVRVINVLYPYLVETTNNKIQGDTFAEATYTNPCAATNWPVMDALAKAMTITGETNVYNLDLRASTAFGAKPTGTRVYDGGAETDGDEETAGGPTRTGSFLWLTRTKGYPYPTPTGATQAGNASVDVAVNTIKDTQPPIVTGVPVRAADHSGWFNSPVDILWTASDRPNPGGVGIAGEAQRLMPATAEGMQRRWTSYQFCDKNKLCATGNLDLSTDFTPPTIAVKTDTEPNGKGWWNGPVTVSWSFVSDNVSGAATATVAPSQTHSLNVQGLTVKNGVGTMCDKARNCADGSKAPAASVVLNLDQVEPVVTSTLSSSTPPKNGWYRDDVTVKWAVTDQGGSGVDTARLPDPSKVTGDGKDRVITSSSAYDNADNTAKGTATVSIDRTPPSITISGPSDGAAYSTANRPPAVTCGAVDSLSGVDGSCAVATTRTVIRDSSGSATGSTYTVKANAKDLAGNVAPEKRISYIVEGDVDLQPPIVKGVVRRPADDGSWHTRHVEIDWIVTDPDTDPDPVASPTFTLATEEGPNVVYRSPEVCDGASTPELPKGNCAAAGSAEVHTNLDTIRPNVSVSGPLQGATYTRSNVPEVKALCSDDAPGSGLVADSCVFEETGRVNLQKDDPFSPPGYVLTYVARAKDNAGHTNTSEARTFTLYDFDKVDRGRMVGGVDVGTTKTSFTLRCNGSPNELTATWTGGSFTLTHVERTWCWDDRGWDEHSPDAQMDSLVVWGQGLLKDGTPAHVRFTVSDAGEPAKGVDRMQLIVAAETLIGRADDLGSVAVIHKSSGVHSGGGNAQAEDAAGDGTNDNGELNDPGK